MTQHTNSTTISKSSSNIERSCYRGGLLPSIQQNMSGMGNTNLSTGNEKRFFTGADERATIVASRDRI